MATGGVSLCDIQVSGWNTEEQTRFRQVPDNFLWHPKQGNRNDATTQRDTA